MRDSSAIPLASLPGTLLYENCRSPSSRIGCYRATSRNCGLSLLECSASHVLEHFDPLPREGGLSGYSNWHNEGWLHWCRASDAIRADWEVEEHIRQIAESGSRPPLPLPPALFGFALHRLWRTGKSVQRHCQAGAFVSTLVHCPSHSRSTWDCLQDSRHSGSLPNCRLDYSGTVL